MKLPTSMRKETLVFLMLSSILSGTALVQATPIPQSSIQLQGLDKITGHVFNITTEIDKPIVFGTLTIIPRACYQAPPEDPPESTAFIEIWEKDGDGNPRRILSRWMFASSRALSSLDHPVYDVWVSTCVGNQSPPTA